MKKTIKIRWSNLIMMLAILIFSVVVVSATATDVEVVDKTASVATTGPEKAVVDMVERNKRSAIVNAYNK